MQSNFTNKQILSELILVNEIENISGGFWVNDIREEDV